VPSGRLGATFPPWAAGVLALAAVVAVLLWVGFERDVYAPFFFPLAGALLVAACGLLAVRLGHCRSTPAALVLGLAAALVVTVGPQLVAYVAASRHLPRDARDFVRFVDHRFAGRKLAVHYPAFATERRPAGEGGDTTILWLIAGGELLLLPLMIAGPLVARVWRQPYCEGCGRWSDRRRLGFAPAAEAAFHAALAATPGSRRIDLAALAAATTMPLHPNRPALVGLLDRCSGPTCVGPAGYLSLKRTRGEAVAALGMEPVAPWFRLRERCAELSATETAALLSLLPEPSRAGGTAIVLPSWAAGLPAEQAGATATLTTITQELPAPAADARGRRRAEALNLGFMLAGVGLAFGLLALAVVVEKRSPTAAGVLVGGAIGGCLALLLVVLRDRQLWGDRYLLRRLRTRLAARGDRLLAGDEPDALAVAMVPRSAWSQSDAGEHIDHAFVTVRDGVVLYEGDRLRLRAPAASVIDVRSEPLVVDQYQTHHFVVLAVRGPQGHHELPLVRIGCPLGETLVRGKRRRASVLRRLLSACSPDGPLAAAAGAPPRATIPRTS